MQYINFNILTRIPFYILICLLFFSCSNSTEELIEKLNNKQNWNLIRARAAYSLGEHGDSTAVPYLINALKDEDNNVRWGAVAALGKIRDSEAVEPLCMMLHDKDGDVRGETLVALGKIGDTRAIAPIRLVVQSDSDPTIRSLAARTIKKIEKNNSEGVKEKKKLNTELSEFLKNISSKGITAFPLNENIPYFVASLCVIIGISGGAIGFLTMFHLMILGIKEHNSSGIIRLIVALHSKLISRGEAFIQRSIIITLIVFLLTICLGFSISDDNLRILLNTIGFYFCLGVSLLWFFNGISWYLLTGDKTMKRLGYIGIILSVFMWLFYEKISLLKYILYLVHNGKAN